MTLKIAFLMSLKLIKYHPVHLFKFFAYSELWYTKELKHSGFPWVLGECWSDSWCFLGNFKSYWFPEFDVSQWYLVVLGKYWEELVNLHKLHIHKITYATYELTEWFLSYLFHRKAWVETEKEFENSRAPFLIVIKQKFY